LTSPVERLATALADCYRIERELGQGGMATVANILIDSAGLPLSILARRHSAHRGSAG
jgi:hypothetical protein